MVSSNYDILREVAQKADPKTKEKINDFLNTLKDVSIQKDKEIKNPLNVLNPENKKSNLFDLLSTSVKSKIDNITNNENSTDIISKEDLDEILVKVNSFNFVSALSSNAKKPYDKYDKYDRNKNEKNDYSFLYNDFNLKYQELIYKHKQLENITKDINK